jgi:threonine-phosphate decarboxylase
MATYNEQSEEMGRFQHGGDTYGLGDVVDFSASLNPLGMPMQVVRALKVAAASFEAYPDPLCRDLVAALAQREEVPANQIVVTAGASDAFSRIAAAVKPHKVLVCSPCYSGYEQALHPFWPQVVHHSLVARENFDVTERILDYIEPDIDMLMLCTPNNPTGRVIPRELLCKILRKADRWGTFVVVDECYIDFTVEHSCVSLLDRFPNLIVVKAFTKTYAMAGFRLGYCMSAREDMADAIREAGDPWAVSSPAQVGGMAALEAPGYLQLTRDYVIEQRAVLEEGLRKLGLFVIPSAANFILFQSIVPLYDALLERGFVIRRCANFRGLDNMWYRIAVRTRDQNARLLEAMSEVLS